MAGFAIQAMELQMLIEMRQPNKLLERRRFHALYIGETHVVADQGENLPGVVIREPQAPADFFRHPDAHVDVIIKANAVRRPPEGGRFSNIMKQRSPCQSDRARARQLFEQQKRVHEDVALGMKLWWLLNPFHRRDLG